MLLGSWAKYSRAPLTTVFILQGAFLLFVEVVDDDSLSFDDPVANIFIEMTLATSSSFTNPEVFTASNAIG